MSIEPTFGDELPDPELAAMMAGGRVVEYRPGQYLTREGEPPDCVFILRSGLVKVAQATSNGRTRLFSVRGRGSLLGEMSCLQERNRSVSVIAHTRVIAIRLPCERFRDLFQRSPTVAMAVARQLIRRVHAAERQQDWVTAQPTNLRVAYVLGNLSELIAEARHPVSVDIPFKQYELAQLATTSGPSVHRALTRFRKGLLIETRYGEVNVHCAGCLQAIAAGTNYTDVITRGCASTYCPRR